MGRLNFDKDVIAEIKKSYTENEEIYIRDMKATEINEIESIGVFQRIEPFMKEWEKELKTYNSILDLGCGVGYLFKLLDLEKHVIKVGVDFSSVSIKKCNHFFTGDNYYFYAEDALDFLRRSNDNEYDAVTAFGVIEHIPDRGKVLECYKEMGRVAKRTVLIANYGCSEYNEGFFLTKCGNENKLLFYFKQPMNEFIADVEKSTGLKVTSSIVAKLYNLIAIEKEGQ